MYDTADTTKHHCARVALNIRLYPAQAVILKAATGLELTPDEQLMFVKLFGRPYCGSCVYREVWAALGRRSGKTTVLMALLVLWYSLFVRHTLQEHERGTALLLAPKVQRARKLFRVLTSMLETPALASSVIRVSQSVASLEVQLSTGIDIVVEAANAFTLRGERLVFLGCDEGAFFKDSDSNLFNLDAILESLLPSLSDSQSSVLVIASTPWGQSGPLWQAFCTRAERCDILVANAPTRVINPGLPLDVEQKYAKRFGEIACQREFGAVFGRTEDSLFDPKDIDSCSYGTFEFLTATADEFSAVGALDAAQFSDQFGIAFAKVSANGKRIVVLAADDANPNELSFSLIVQTALKLGRHFGVQKYFSDRVLSRPIQAFVEQDGREYQRVTTMGPEAQEMFDNVRVLFREHLVVLPGGAEKLISQLKALRGILGEGGKLTVDGKHDDIAMAAIIAIHQASAELIRSVDEDCALRLLRMTADAAA